MKLIYLLALTFTLSIAHAETHVDANGLTWHTDLAVAQKKSEDGKKPIFAFFTGSDWCGWCKMLQKNVFAKQKFIDWAKEEVVLLELDFPKRTPQKREQQIQNQNLQRALGVSGYPTVWLINAEKKDNGGFHLKKLGKLGYPRGGEKGKEEDVFLMQAKAILDRAEKKS
jgi:protein disulfide-isomerase